MMKTLLLNPPSYDDFDGGAGSRYQATREVWSFWYPTWLCYPAGMIPGSRVLDAPPEHLNQEQTVAIAKDYDFVVLHTSTPSFKLDIRTAELIKDVNPHCTIAFVGGHVTTQPEESSRRRRRSIWWRARNSISPSATLPPGSTGPKSPASAIAAMTSSRTLPSRCR